MFPTVNVITIGKKYLFFSRILLLDNYLFLFYFTYFLLFLFNSKKLINLYLELCSN